METELPAEPAEPHASGVRLAAATLATGLAAGVAVVILVLIIHTLEHAVWGHAPGPFLDDLAYPWRWQPLLTVTAAGVLGAAVWYAIRRWWPVPSVDAAVEGARMPFWPTVADTVVQVTSVGLGASIGKELAPRELAAMFTSRIVRWFGVGPVWGRVLVASAAGAGLAGVYNVPLAGVAFALEVLLGTFGGGPVLVALGVSLVATLVARPVVGDHPLFRVPEVNASASLLVATLLLAPVLGVLGRAFMAATKVLPRPTGVRLLLVLPVTFALVGLVGVAYPLALGNGRALGQAALEQSVPVAALVVLALVKFVATSASLGGGASGGTLQPSVAIGAALGAAAAAGWAHVWPGAGATELAIVGAAAMLAATMRAPVTAMLLLIEFTGTGTALAVPLVAAVALGALASRVRLPRTRPGAGRSASSSA